MFPLRYAEGGANRESHYDDANEHLGRLASRPKAANEPVIDGYGSIGAGTLGKWGVIINIVCSSAMTPVWCCGVQAHKVKRVSGPRSIAHTARKLSWSAIWLLYSPLRHADVGANRGSHYGAAFSIGVGTLNRAVAKLDLDGAGVPDYAVIPDANGNDAGDGGCGG